MAKRRFVIELSCVIEIDSEVIRAVSKDWRKRFYELETPGEIAEHLAFNMLVNGRKLSQLDGFADLPNDAATIPADDIEIQCVDELAPRRKRK
jgi:hypothetical protein